MLVQKYNPQWKDMFLKMSKILEDNDELNPHIVFRDFLRENNLARDEYQTLKLELAEETDHNYKIYASLKETRAGGFVEGIIVRAGNIR